MNRLPQNAAKIVDAETWLRVGELLMQHRGERLGSRDMANALQCTKGWVLPLLLVMREHKIVKLGFGVYHRCTANPVACRDFEKGFQPTPWVCPECDEYVTSPDELTYDLLCIVPTQFDIDSLIPEVGSK